MSIRPDQLTGTQPPREACHMAWLVETGVSTLKRWKEPRGGTAYIPVAMDAFQLLEKVQGVFVVTGCTL